MKYRQFVAAMQRDGSQEIKVIYFRCYSLNTGTVMLPAIEYRQTY